MLNRVNRLTISKNIENRFTFSIKAPQSVSPMQLSSSDSFTVKLIRLDNDDVIDLVKNAAIVSADEGTIELIISPGEASGLISNKGNFADKYYPIATYRMAIYANTQSNGPFIAVVGRVYVRE